MTFTSPKRITDIEKNGGNGGNGNGNGHNEEEDLIIFDDDYYLDRGDFPPRFTYYRHTIKKLNLPREYVTTPDELNYAMKQMLRMSPEDRYQHNKANFLFPDLSFYMRGLGEDDYGCTGAGCIPECRFYPKYGRIEDSEIIEEYKKTEQSGRQRNTVVDIDPPDEDTHKESLIEFYNNKQNK